MTKNYRLKDSEKERIKEQVLFNTLLNEEIDGIAASTVTEEVREKHMRKRYIRKTDKLCWWRISKKSTNEDNAEKDKWRKYEGTAINKRHKQ